MTGLIIKEFCTFFFTKNPKGIFLFEKSTKGFLVLFSKGSLSWGGLSSSLSWTPGQTPCILESEFVPFVQDHSFKCFKTTKRNASGQTGQTPIPGYREFVPGSRTNCWTNHPRTNSLLRKVQEILLYFFQIKIPFVKPKEKRVRRISEIPFVKQKEKRVRRISGIPFVKQKEKSGEPLKPRCAQLRAH